MKIQSDSSRNEIIQRIAVAKKMRTAIVELNNHPEPTYKPIYPDKINCFINELEAVNGQCVLCENENDLYLKFKSFVDKRKFNYLFCQDTYLLQQIVKNGMLGTNDRAKFNDMQVGVTACEFLVARTGSVLVSSFTSLDKQMNVFPPIHIVIANVSQLVEYVEDALIKIQQKYNDSFPSIISTITGPSRTADIEKTLVLGAHGPKEFIVFLSKV